MRQALQGVQGVKRQAMQTTTPLKGMIQELLDKTQVIMIQELRNIIRAIMMLLQELRNNIQVIMLLFQEHQGKIP